MIWSSAREQARALDRGEIGTDVEVLLRLALDLEAATDWTSRRAPAG